MPDECAPIRPNSILQIITEIEGIIDSFNIDMDKHVENINYILNEDFDKSVKGPGSEEESLKANSIVAKRLVHILEQVDGLKKRLNYLDNNIDLN